MQNLFMFMALFSKHCSGHGVKVSPSSPNLKEMNGQAEKYFGAVMDMARSMLKTSGMEERYWDLTV